jgi:hypothetical protein
MRRKKVLEQMVTVRLRVECSILVKNPTGHEFVICVAQAQNIEASFRTSPRLASSSLEVGIG